MDLRLTQLKTWVANQLNISEFSLETASSDASFRRYFRLTYDGHTRIVMDAPPDKEDSRPFVHIARLFIRHRLAAPEIYVEDYAQGFFILGDLGSQQYLQVLTADNANELYNNALSQLNVLYEIPDEELSQIPDYDEPLLLNEMELFRQWYLGEHLQLQLDTAQHACLDKTFALLAQQALQQPQVLVHRDYHSRNLMYLAQRQQPGILDFQDAMIGPISYDVVSLLRDCYIAWPRLQVLDWLSQHYQRTRRQGLLAQHSEAQYLRDFELMGLQRHLKAIGIFARLNYRDHKPGYLHDVPRTLTYVADVCQRYADLSDFAQLLTDLKVI